MINDDELEAQLSGSASASALRAATPAAATAC
jgi:hypothetical protein